MASMFKLQGPVTGMRRDQGIINAALLRNPLPLLGKPGAECACGGRCPSCQSKGIGVGAGNGIGAPNDKYEQEADRVADEVAQTKLDGILSPPTYAAHRSGDALSQPERTYFEARLGHEFSQVRIHTDEQAARLAESTGARAFTTGADVVFGRGQYAPQSEPGRRLLAHELTHVVQQGSAPAQEVPGSPGTHIGFTAARGMRLQKQEDVPPAENGFPKEKLCATDCSKHCPDIAIRYLQELCHEFAPKDSPEISQGNKDSCQLHPDWRSGKTPYIWTCQVEFTVKTKRGHIFKPRIFVKLTHDWIVVWDLPGDGKTWSSYSCGPVCEYAYKCEADELGFSRLRIKKVECVEEETPCICDWY